MIIVSYEKFNELLSEKGYKTADVVSATGIAASTFSDWKSGDTKPKADKLYAMAKFLNVSMEYFIVDDS